MWLFYLLLFLLPANLAKHFPIAASYVSGFKVDYLIPSVYLTDIILILLLIFFPVKKFSKAVIIFLLCLLPSVIFAHSFWPAAYKFLKIIELTLFGLWIYQYKKQISREKIIKILSLSVLFQSLLALAQWFKQSSVFSFKFLGEQPYNATTPGIDKITWFNGALKIPPLGTFPHPNVLAGFLVLSICLILQGQNLKSLKNKVCALTAILLGIITLFLTFSLSAWLAFLLVGLPLALKLDFRKYLIYYGGFLIVFSLLGPRFSYLAPESSFSRRSQLASMSLQMFTAHPLTGVGLNNFTVVMDQYGLIPATTRFLQPVHNIYLLLLSETGLLGFFGFLYLLYKTRRYPLNAIFLIILFLSLFDHYFFTLQQGLLLLTFFLSCNMI